MFQKKGKIITGVSVGFVGLLLVAVNVACGIMNEDISIYLNGYGNDFSKLNYEQGDQVCQDLEADGIVLLKNKDNALPLSSLKKVNVFGWGGSDGGFILSGAGSGSSTDRGSGTKVTLLQAFEKKGIETNSALNDVYSSYASARDNGDYWNAAYPFFNLIEPPVSQIDPLIDDCVSYSDNAVVVISRLGGEGQDLPHTQKKTKLSEDTSKTYLQLSTEEEGLLDSVENAGFAKVVVILNTCNTMELGFLNDDRIDAAISVSAPGQSGALSIVDVLTGEVNPSGKTADTYAYDLTTAASYANCPNCREINNANGGIKSYTNGGNYIDYQEGIYVGYRFYETADSEGYFNDVANDYGTGYDGVVQYPFGYGLNYSTFDWSINSVEPESGSTITPDTEITVKVWVTNTSEFEGKDVVELYYSSPYNPGGIEKSSICLADFDKTQTLEKNGGDKSSQLLTLSFKASDMKSYDSQDANGNGFSGYEMEKGDYSISVRKNAHQLAGISGDQITYHLDKDYQLKSDDTTGNEVTNRFTGETADDGVSIDGSNSNANISYMKRDDLANTFPSRTTTRRAKTSNIISLANHWLTDKKDTDEMPTQGDSSTSLSLYNTDGTLNTDLIFKLGKDYNDENYEDLLNQITTSELNTIIEGDGYRTPKVASIGKPEIQDLDGPSGLNDTNMSSDTKSKWTSFPVETLIAQTWSKRLAYIYGLAVGNEASATKVGGWYAPACNIHRNSFDGRNFEYYSEDPYLSGIMCAKTVSGAMNNGLYCYLKHFAVNETENGRSGLYTWLTEQSMREIYLKPFEIAVKKGKANAIMSSFNRVGATWTGGSYALLTEVLRNEWGFKGSVLTDYSTGGDYMNVDQGIRAGNDLWLNGLRSGSVSGHSDKTSATAISCARDCAHNMVYTYCNTVYNQNLYATGETNDEESQFKVEVGGKSASTPSHTWVYLLVAGDVVLVAGLGVLSFFAFFKKKKTTDTK
ncbi:MAG: glycoside hydrolase family 3 N-terminal domain-containing protein [Bacilli bacterium]